MEFEFNINSVVDSQEDITVWNREKILKRKSNIQKFQYLVNVIDKMGIASAKAQNLPQVITTTSKMLATDSNLYLYATGNKAIGILKVGIKKLFIRNEIGTYSEIEPLCVLDFYVHETMQRKGIGKILFEKMLKEEKVVPKKLGYDRPSSKLLAFLRKYYNLTDYIPQANNYVVFNDYFDDVEQKEDTMATIAQRPLTTRNKKSTDSPMSPFASRVITPKMKKLDDGRYLDVRTPEIIATSPSAREATIIKQFYTNKPRPF